MRLSLILLALCFSPLAHGQNIYTTGYHGAIGPYQPSRTGGYWFYNSSARYYPVSYPTYYGGYGGAAYWQREESLYELRQIRREVEDINWRRRWER